jgi:hypothetical protein
VSCQLSSTRSSLSTSSFRWVCWIFTECSLNVS